MLSELLSNKIFLAVIIAALLSQGSKIVMNSLKDRRRISLTDFIVTGGMPSTHCALVSSLLLILLLQQGLSPATIVALVLFVIVVTDSMGVRRTAGEEAKLLNKIIKIEHLKIAQIRYSLGHRPIEALAGTIIGFAVAIAVALL